MKLKCQLALLLCFVFFSVNAQKATEESKTFATRYSVSPVTFNSSAAEFCPFFHKDKLYFISNRNEKVVLTYTSSDNQNTSDIFVANRLDSTHFSKPKSLSEINSKFDDGPAMLNENGNYMLFSASNSKGKLQLYFSVFENATWSKPMLHPVSRPGNSYCHPFLSANGKVLFFSSDREGGFGGMDLYYSKLENLTWSNPVNLGPKVNSAANEVFPFISTNNQLYFSSKRNNGLGNLDIYSFDLSDSVKAQIHLLESPINSGADDFGISLENSQNSGYFSSNRGNADDDNIYYFSKTIPSFESCAPLKKSSCYTFYKDTYSLKDESGESVYEWDLGDGTKARAKALKHCYSSPGFYTVKLNVVEKTSGKLVYNELSYTIAVRPQGLQVEVKDSLFLNEPVVFDASSSQIEGYTILNYNWIFNDTSFSKGAKVTHVYRENGIYLVELGVEAQNNLTKKIKKFCVDKRILVGDRAYVSKNLRFFKYAELLPDADSLYFQDEEIVGLNKAGKKKVFQYKNLSADAYGLTGDENGDVLLSEKERLLRTHKFALLGADSSAFSSLDDDEAGLNAKSKKLRSHKYNELGADTSALDNQDESETFLRAKQKLMRFKNAELPPIVDTLYYPKETSPTVYRVNLGWSDNRVDMKSGVFDGIEKLEETQEGSRYRYTSGKEKDFNAILPYYDNAKKRGFKDAAVIGFENEKIGKGQAKNLRAILFDSASVENHALKIYFKYNVPTYEAMYNAQLDALIKKTLEHEGQKVLLITHFDGLGALDYNMKLNQERTNNLIRYLVAKGIKKTQIKTEFIIHPTENLEPDLLRRIEVFTMN